MKAERATKARTGAPFWVKAAASVASVAMLLAISSYNVVPTLRRAADGDTASIGLAAVQIAFTIILAVIPFVPGWSAETRKLLTLAFMIGKLQGIGMTANAPRTISTRRLLTSWTRSKPS
jgi:hypothetical protein